LKRQQYSMFKALTNHKPELQQVCKEKFYPLAQKIAISGKTSSEVFYMCVK